MKTLYKYFTLLFCLAFVFQICACHDHDHEGHNHDGHEHGADTHAGQNDHDDHGDEKIITLNNAQYLNAEIDTGWFFIKNLSDVIHANGHTELDPQSQADVSTTVNGTIKSIKVIEGDYVKKGQTLATITSLGYNNKLVEKLDYNNKQLEKARLTEELTIAEANIIYLQKEYNRQEKLAEDNINAQKVFEKVATDLQKENAKIEGARKQIQIIEEAIGIMDNKGGSSVSIMAPISGYITDINVHIGSSITPGQSIFSLVDNSKMHIDLLVYEKDLAKVKVGQKVRFILTNQSNKEITGEIYNIGKSFEQDTKSVAVHADIDENDANLIPGMYINALIAIGTNTVNALPEAAVVMAEGRNFVFLWKNENIDKHEDDHEGHDHGEDDHTEEITFARLEVKTGASQLGYVEVTPLGEIHDGNKIVINGAYYLQSHLQKAEGGGGHHH